MSFICTQRFIYMFQWIQTSSICKHHYSKEKAKFITLFQGKTILFAISSSSLRTDCMILMIPCISSLASLDTSVVHWSKPNCPSYVEALWLLYPFTKTCSSPVSPASNTPLKDEMFSETFSPRQTDFTWSAPSLILECLSCSLRGLPTPLSIKDGTGQYIFNGDTYSPYHIIGFKVNL